MTNNIIIPKNGSNAQILSITNGLTFSGLDKYINTWENMNTPYIEGIGSLTSITIDLQATDSWHPSNPDLVNPYYFQGNTDYLFLNWGGVNDLACIFTTNIGVSVDDDAAIGWRSQVISTGNYIWRWRFSGEMEGLNRMKFKGKNSEVSNVKWECSNPNAITPVGKNIDFNSGEKFTWLQVSFTKIQLKGKVEVEWANMTVDKHSPFISNTFRPNLSYGENIIDSNPIDLNVSDRGEIDWRPVFSDILGYSPAPPYDPNTIGDVDDDTIELTRDSIHGNFEMVLDVDGDIYTIIPVE